MGKKPLIYLDIVGGKEKEPDEFDSLLITLREEISKISHIRQTFDAFLDLVPDALPYLFSLGFYQPAPYFLLLPSEETGLMQGETDKERMEEAINLGARVLVSVTLGNKRGVKRGDILYNLPEGLDPDIAASLVETFAQALDAETSVIPPLSYDFWIAKSSAYGSYGSDFRIRQWAAKTKKFPALAISVSLPTDEGILSREGYTALLKGLMRGLEELAYKGVEENDNESD